MTSVLRSISWVVGAACLAGLAYLIYVQGAVRVPQAQPASVLAGEQAAEGFAAGQAGADAGLIEAAPRAAPAGAREYRSEAYHISLFYPDSLSVKGYDEGKGAATITFQDIKTAQGFQIFVVPYSSAQISRARFVQDVPSGTMNSPLNVEVGGVAATSFYSANQLLGETAEVWFLRGGLLYEVTAPKAQAAWLSGILNTWRFI